MGTSYYIILYKTRRRQEVIRSSRSFLAHATHNIITCLPLMAHTPSLYPPPPPPDHSFARPSAYV